MEETHSILETGSEITTQAHRFASIILGASFLIIVPLLVFAFERLIDRPPFLITLGIIFSGGALYYLIIPTKVIKRGLYLLMDYFFFVTLTILFSFAHPLIGIPALFFYMVLFVVIDAIAYGWRDFAIIGVGASLALALYNFMYVPQLLLFEQIGMSIIQITMLWILGIDIRMLAERALKEEKERTALEAELKRFQELDSLKSEFLDVASHQMRTPLTEARWAFHALKEQSLPSAADDLVRKGAFAVERMVQLVNVFLNAASAEKKQLLQGEENIDISALAEEVAKEYQDLAKEKEVSLSFRGRGGLSISGDRFLLKGAIANIVDNAIRYTPRRGSVYLKVEKGEKAAILSIKDNGIGMNTEEKAKIFNKFYRAPGAMKMHTDGSGLGLYYAKSIIERHKGTIEITSEARAGTEVLLTLPAAS